MVSVELAQYISNQLSQGRGINQIRQNLLKIGWSYPAIYEAVNEVQKSNPQLSIMKLPNPLELLSEAWIFYRPLIWKFLKIDLIWFAIYIPTSVVVFLLIFLCLLVIMHVKWMIVVILPLIFMLVLILLAVSTWDEAGIIELIKDGQEKVSVTGIFKRSRHLLLPLVWLNIMVSIIVVFGLFLLIVPGVIFSVWYFAAPFILFTEGDTGGLALSKSKKYVKGHFWAVLGRMSFLISIWVALEFIIESIQVVLNSGSNLSFSFAEGIGEIIANIFAFVILVSIILLLPLLVTYAFVLYRHLQGIYISVSKIGIGSTAQVR